MSDLDRVKTLAELLVKKTALAKENEKLLKEQKAQIRQIEQEDLPLLMKEIGLSEITLEDGSKITLFEDCEAAITKAKHDAAMKWLVDNNFDGLIKCVVGIEFGKGDHDEAKELRDAIATDHPEVQLIETVHPATLKSFVKEQMQAGKPLPMDTFSVRSFSRVKVKAK